MDNEVTVVCWSKLDVDIGILWRRLVSITITSVRSKKARMETHCHIHFENSLYERRFSRVTLLCLTTINFDIQLRGGSICAPSLKREFGIYQEYMSCEV